MIDPFGTAALRESVLAAWRGSPTRLREDAASEGDLVRAGYRDRLLTELAQNAADAAAAASVAGRMSVELDSERRILRLSNTGAALTATGVQAMAALRASGKEATADATGAVGRFGVGFTAVLAVADEIEVRSTSGSVRFSAADTARAVREAGIEAMVVPPALRLVWPVHTGPQAGWDTEVLLRLRGDVDPAALRASLRGEAAELLLELPALESITVDGDEYRRAETELDGGVVEIRLSGERWWQFATPRARWLLPVDDMGPVQAAPDVLRAPTRSDEELSLPALLVADVAMQPDRRRLLPGADLAELASGYADFARALAESDRLVLVPAPGFPRSAADDALRAALLAELRDRPWLPTLGGDERPARALALPGLTEPLADLLREVIPGLVAPALADRTAALTAAGATVIGPARLVELLAGSDRPAHWWRALYAALEPLLAEPRGAEELGALPVPLTDGRLVTGPRTVVLADLERQAQAGQDVPVHWARVVHPEAAHPLLGRLGARTVTAADLLSDPALRAELEDGEQADDLADTVLRLAGQVGPAGRLPAWLGALELPDAAGGTTPADELLLPDAPLAHVLVADSPFGVVADDVVREYGAAALRSVGVGATFGLLTEPDPTGPDHDLDDEETWWDELAEDPVVLTAVRDLDLVAADRWSQTLAMLAEDPALAAALSDRHGYTAWWLRRHARIGGVPLGALRSPDDDTFAGLLDPLEHPAASMLRAVLADPADLDRVAAEALLAALGDPQRHPTPAAVVDAHRLLAGANIVCDNVALPSMVRAASGATVEPRQALVLDQPWYVCAISPDRLVVGDLATAPELAELLDLPLASQAVSAEVVSVGRLTTWEREPGAVLIRTVVELPCARGDLVMHETLEIRLGGAVTGTMAVPWWVVGTTTHLAGSAILSR